MCVLSVISQFNLYRIFSPSIIKQEEERSYISPYNDADVIAGQGTIG